MAMPRSRYVREGEEAVYHCFSRCVRRAFLCGVDPVTGRDFSHRKSLLLDRMRFLAAVFAIEVCAYAILENHYHSVLRTRPDLVARWSDDEVARRWLTLFPRHRDPAGAGPTAEEIRALAECPERIRVLRKRLVSLSWFMGRLNESIARAANREDEVKGRFWESRFRCQALLDEAAIVAGMVYVDLNPIRAGRAESPEESDFTSIQERIRAWQAEAAATARDVGGAQEGETQTAVCRKASWLCPIESEGERRGVLGMTAPDYFDLVDRTGRMVREGKRGAIDPALAPILWRIGANPKAWPATVASFGSKFRLAAGLLSSLREFADRIGQRWVKGTAAARVAFAVMAR